MALPPALQAVNGFIKNHAYLSRKNFAFLSVMDNRYNVNLIYSEPDESNSRTSLNFVSFDTEGNVRIAPKEILANAGNYSLDEVESCILSDGSRNTHLLLRKTPDFNSMQYVYIMIDSIGNIQKNITLEKGLYLSKFCILPSGNIITQGTIGGQGEDKKQYNLICVLEKDSSSFYSFRVGTADFGYLLPNTGADIYPIDNENILLLRLYSNSISKENTLHKTIINLPTKTIVDAELIDPGERASIIYSNIIPNLWYGGNPFITLGDTIGYRFLLFPKKGSDISQYKMGIILFDSKSNLLEVKQQRILTMTAQNLITSNRSDFLIRNNRNTFGESITTPEYRLSLYGLISFRDFPGIIIDPGLK